MARIVHIKEYKQKRKKEKKKKEAIDNNAIDAKMFTLLFCITICI
jgi:hypothetical protein